MHDYWNLLNSIHPVKEPEGYDLNLVSDIETDIPYLINFNQLDNKISGQTLSVNIGGGTNLSEYELLTSNSMKLLSGVTPFVSLKLKSAKSIVSYLENLGYETMGIHGSDASNYSRARAYPNLGFDYIRFIDDFTKIYNYGKRSVMDQCLYENMHEVEKQMDPQRPHFIFCLTMQNHGDWDMNDSSFDIVQVKGDYGSYTDCINEYLTSIYLSDQAFRGLIDYYSEVDRPTIICMMGDHAPTYVEDIADQNLPELEKGIKMRSTPFVIWANFPIDEQESGDISMIYAVPLLLKTAGLPLSPYYRYLRIVSVKSACLSHYD